MKLTDEEIEDIFCEHSKWEFRGDGDPAMTGDDFANAARAIEAAVLAKSVSKFKAGDTVRGLGGVVYEVECFYVCYVVHDVADDDPMGYTFQEDGLELVEEEA